jgi:hypothetical protein
VTDTLNSRVAVSLNQGGGAFADPVFYPTAEGPGGVTIGDFNGDGRPDIAVSAVQLERFCLGGTQNGEACQNESDCPGGLCSARGNASVLLQQANGSFGPSRNREVEETPIGIAALSVNCDANEDLIVANFASSSVMVLRSNGNGEFTLAQTLGEAQVGQNPIDFAVADFDRDGVDDFAVVNTRAPGASANVRLFRGNCGAPFALFPSPFVSQIRIGELANALVARDFTGDQVVDLAVSSQTSNEVCVLLGDANAGLRRTPFGGGSCDRVSRMPSAVAAGDFDGDGRYDAASANNDASANNVSVLSNCVRDAGCDPFPPLPSATPLPGAPALRGDANGDARRSAADLVAISAEVMDNDGFQVEAIGRGSFRAAPGADANGDGRVDTQDRVATARRIFGGA